MCEEILIGSEMEVCRLSIATLLHLDECLHLHACVLKVVMISDKCQVWTEPTLNQQFRATQVVHNGKFMVRIRVIFIVMNYVKTFSSHILDIKYRISSPCPQESYDCSSPRYSKTHLTTANTMMITWL